MKDPDGHRHSMANVVDGGMICVYCGLEATMSHTPGPWEVREVKAYGGQHLAWEVEGPKPPQSLAGRFVNHADARLIAAAPDTTSELAELVAMVAGKKRCCEDCAATLDRAIAALTKAGVPMGVNIEH